MTTLAERLAIAMDGPPKVRPIDLARACGVKQPSVSGWLSGKSTKMEGANLLAAAEFLGVNYWWLADGRAPMRPEDRGGRTSTSAGPATDPRPKWPFPSLPEPAVAALPPADRHRLEGALALAIAQVGMRLEAAPPPNLEATPKIETIVGNVTDAAANDPQYVAIQKMQIKISAGVAGYSVDSQEDQGDGGVLFLPRRWVVRKHLMPQALFATSARGMSMFPRVHEGDTVIVNTADTQHRNDEVFAVNHEGEFTLKRLRRVHNRWWLYSDNPDQTSYGPVMCTERTQTIGKVVLLQAEEL